MSSDDDLPDDNEALKQALRSERLQKRELAVLVEHLKLQIARMVRRRFGRSSEKLDDGQLDLLAQSMLAANDAIAPEDTATTTAGGSGKQPETDASSEEQPAPAKRRRGSVPAHLPRDVVNHATVCACPDCGGRLRRLGEDVSELMEFVPSYFRAIRHVRPKTSCVKCSRIVQAPAPSRPIPRSFAGPGLLAHVLVSKFCDHVPLYRQEQIYARHGVDLDRSTLGDLVGASAKLLDPLIESLARYTMEPGKVHGDDTPMPVLDPGRGKTKTGRMWTYVRDDRPAGSTEPPAVLFRYSPDRKGERPAAHLAGFSGIFQADGYGGFNRLYRDGSIVEAACWAHYPERRFI